MPPIRRFVAQRGGLAVMLALSGCLGHSDKPADTPTIDTFSGRLTHQGEPIRFAEGEKVQLKLIRLPAVDTWGIPIADDGTFQIGWMPVGRYTAQLLTTKKRPGGRGAAESVHSIPEFEILEGETEYAIELGSNWKN